MRRATCALLAAGLVCLLGCGESPSTATGLPSTTSTPASATTATPAGEPTATPRQAEPPTVRAGVAMPNARLTPGATFTGVTVAEVCTPGWATSHRHVTSAQYHEVYGEYGIRYPEPTGSYELDHLIPLELGGDNANANLWPEPASPTPGFHQKDDLENALHARVCARSIGLAEAEHAIAVNWYGAYVRYVGA